MLFPKRNNRFNVSSLKRGKRHPFVKNSKQTSEPVQIDDLCQQTLPDLHTQKFIFSNN